MAWLWVMTVLGMMLIEWFRYLRTCRSLQQNRLRHLDLYDGFLSSMEHYLECKWQAFTALFEWAHGAGPLTPTSLEQEQDNLRQSIQQLVVGASGRPLTFEEQARVEKLASRLQQLVDRQRQQQQKQSTTTHAADVVQNVLVEPVGGYVTGMVDNVSKVIHFWAFSPLDAVGYLYRCRFESRIEAAGFEKRISHGLTIYVRPGRAADGSPLDANAPDAEPPVVVFHGISTVLVWLDVLAAKFPPSRTILFPRHPALLYSTAVFAEGELPSTCEYVRRFARFLDSQSIREIDVVAWSFGGYTRNMLSVEWGGRFRREVLIEPLGTPMANAVGCTYNLWPLWKAYRKARQYAPHARRWHVLLTLIYLRWHVHTRPLHTDPLWHRQSIGKHGSWDGESKLVILGKDDIITAGTEEFLEEQCPQTSYYSHPGEHGCWPLDHQEDCMNIIDNWIN